MFEWMMDFITQYGYAGIFIVMLLLNAVPFLMPPNWLVVALFGAAFPDMNPIFLGMASALGTSLGRMEVYVIGRGASRLMRQERRAGLTTIGQMIGNKGGIIAAFIFGSTPLPDDLLIVNLAIMRYNLGRLFVGYFLGKLWSHIAAIYLFKISAHSIGDILGQNLYGIIVMAVSSIAFTVGALLIDWEKLILRFCDQRAQQESS